MWQATKPKVEKSHVKYHFFSFNFLSFFLLCIFLQHPHTNGPHRPEHQMRPDWQIGTWWKWVWTKIVCFTAEIIGIAEQETMAVWIDVAWLCSYEHRGSFWRSLGRWDIGFDMDFWPWEFRWVVDLAWDFWICFESCERISHGSFESFLSFFKALKAAMMFFSNLLFLNFLYSFIQLIGLSLHIQITINKTQIKDPIHCSILHQKLFPSNFEALELPRYGSGVADHFVIVETIKRWFWMIIFRNRWLKQTQKNFIEN